MFPWKLTYKVPQLPCDAHKEVEQIFQNITTSIQSGTKEMNLTYDIQIVYLKYLLVFYMDKIKMGK
jgi:hypothetical protein